MAVQEDPPPGVPEWVVTFGDMMSLLLTFFIMLVSLSEIKEEERYQAMVESFRRQFGYESSLAAMAPGRTKPRNAQLAKLATQGRANRLDTLQGGDKVEAPVGEHPRVRLVRPGGKTGVGCVIFFEPGEVELSERNKADLRREAAVIGGKPQKIEIRGHAALGPESVAGSPADSWSLAFERSRRTMDYLVQEAGIDPKRIRLGVAARNEPLHTAPDPNKLRLNSRVEVYLLEELVGDLLTDPSS